MRLQHIVALAASMAWAPQIVVSATAQEANTGKAEEQPKKNAGSSKVFSDKNKSDVGCDEPGPCGRCDCDSRGYAPSSPDDKTERRNGQK